MKILHVAPVFPPHIGGLQTYLHGLVTRLHLAGHDVSVITSDTHSVGSSILNGVEIQRLPMHFKLYEAPICLSLPLRLCKQNANIIHAHMPPRFFLECTTLLHKLKFLSHAPLVLGIHLYQDHYENAPFLINLISKFYYKKLAKSIFRQSSRIIVPCEAYHKLIVERFNIMPEKISVLPYGIDLDIFNPNNFQHKKIKQEYILNSNRVILFVGRLTAQGAAQKGIRYLLRAMPEVVMENRNVKLIVVGGGDQLEHLKTFAENLGISPYIKFMGDVSDSQIPSLISIADVFTLPSLNESFGIALAEAMAMEKPVIATRINPFVDLVEDGKTGLLVEPRNSRELAHAISRLLCDSALAERFGREARETIRRKYDWRIILQQTIKIYDEILGK